MNFLPSWWWGTSNDNPKDTNSPNSMDVIEQTENSKEALEARILQAKKKSRNILKEAQTEKDPKRQIQLMKRKKQYDIQIQQLEGQIANLEQTSNAVQSASMAKDMVDIMKDSNVAMKHITSKMSVVDVTNVTDELNNTMIDINDIQRELSRPMGMDVLDQEEMEEDILNEIASWKEEEYIKEAQKVDDSLPVLPPKKEPVYNNNNNNNNDDGHYKIKATEI